MARVLVCADGFFRGFSPVALEPYIEMFINSLIKAGNEVMPLIAKDYEHKHKLKRDFYKYQVTQEVKHFNPDIIFTFNNRIEESFLKATEAPIVVVASDTPIFWSNIELIKKYNDRYYVFYFNDDFAKDLVDNFKINYNRQLLLPYTTDIKALDVEQNKDITFVGNFMIPVYNTFENFLFGEAVPQKEELLKQAIKEYEQFREFNQETIGKIQNLNQNTITVEEIKSAITLAFTNNKRISLLESVSDLDLNIYCWGGNLSCINSHYKIFKNIHYYDKICSWEQTQKIYNESKISLSMPHAQAKTGFSWRVCDILATNSLLISNPVRDLNNLFQDLIPTYTDEKDLQEKCIYYLKHENERKEIVLKAQELVEKNHRFIHLIQEVEEFMDIKLIYFNKVGKSYLPKRTKEKTNRYYKKIRMK